MIMGRVNSLCCSYYSRLGNTLWKWFIGALALSYSGLIQPRGAGFYCDDKSIRFPYQGDTISVTQLFLGSLLAPIFFILPAEYIRKWKKFGEASLRAVWPSAWSSSWQVWRAVLLGNLTVLVVTEFSKSLISEARPHFWDSCKPNVTQEMCESGYITNFTCTSDFSMRKILDAQKSFPSGHTSVSAFAAVFMIWYLERAVKWRHSFFVKPVLQLVWVCFGILCALTRITDKRHHWWDVLAGATLGLSIGFTMIQAMSRRVRWDVSQEDSLSSTNSSDQCKDGNVNFLLKSNPSSDDKRPSVRRLLSTSSATTTIAEDQEVNF